MAAVTYKFPGRTVLSEISVQEADPYKGHRGGYKWNVAVKSARILGELPLAEARSWDVNGGTVVLRLNHDNGFDAVSFVLTHAQSKGLIAEGHANNAISYFREQMPVVAPGPDAAAAAQNAALRSLAMSGGTPRNRL